MAKAPIKVVWGSTTSNTLTLNETQQGNGIVFESDIVSNFLNGALQLNSQAIRNLQVMGGYYDPSQSYKRYQFCTQLTASGNDYCLNLYMADQDNPSLPPTNANQFQSGTTDMQIPTNGDSVNSGWKKIKFFTTQDRFAVKTEENTFTNNNTFNQDVLIKRSLTSQGTTNLQGNTTIGTSSSNTCTINATTTIPNLSNTTLKSGATLTIKDGVTEILPNVFVDKTKIISGGDNSPISSDRVNIWSSQYGIGGQTLSLNISGLTYPAMGKNLALRIMGDRNDNLLGGKWAEYGDTWATFVKTPSTEYMRIGVWKNLIGSPSMIVTYDGYTYDYNFGDVSQYGKLSNAYIFVTRNIRDRSSISCMFGTMQGPLTTSNKRSCLFFSDTTKIQNASFGSWYYALDPQWEQDYATANYVNQKLKQMYDHIDARLRAIEEHIGMPRSRARANEAREMRAKIDNVGDIPKSKLYQVFEEYNKDEDFRDCWCLADDDERAELYSVLNDDNAVREIMERWKAKKLERDRKMREEAEARDREENQRRQADSEAQSNSKSRSKK